MAIRKTVRKADPRLADHEGYLGTGGFAPGMRG